MNIHKLMTELSIKRPLFHSEADFQHALAWEIRSRFPDARIRLEYRPSGFARMYVDMWVVLASGAPFAIELKYKTRAFSMEHLGEAHELLDQGAQDQGRYDFLLDVSRLESLTKAQPKARGIAILLTNDSSYWAPARSVDAFDSAFRLHDGRIVTGRLAWARGASAGTMRGREKLIPLTGAYDVKWHKYSEMPLKKRGLFKYALLNIWAGREMNVY